MLTTWQNNTVYDEVQDRRDSDAIDTFGSETTAKTPAAKTGPKPPALF